MSVITLLTDFGLKDGNVGVMKGVIWSIAPHTHISDLSHLIPPQNIAEGALILARAAPYFAAGTVHIAVIDPGVGTSRRPIAAQIGSQFFVGPDNGLFTPLIERAEEAGEISTFIHLNRPDFWLKEVSHVFHGRDIFAPCGAHLATGVPLASLGVPIYDPVRLKLSQPKPTPSGWTAEIIHIDHFGNLSTSLRVEHLRSSKVKSIRLYNHKINGMVQTFGERLPGELVALFGSNGNLIISVVNGNAAQLLNAQVGDPVEVKTA